MSVFTGSKRPRTGATFVPAESAFEDTTIAGTLDVTGDATFGDANDSVVISDGQIQFKEGSSVWSFIQRSNQLAPGNGSSADDLIVSTDGGVWIQADKNDNGISGNKAFAVQYRTDGTTRRLFDVDANGYVSVPTATTNPSAPADGSLYYNTADKEFKYYDSSAASWRTIHAEGTNMPFLNYQPQSTAPPASDGRTYYDDGTNTSSGLRGLRMYRQDEAAFSDIPMYKQGSFTPKLGDGTNDFTMGVQNGRYIRIGNFAHIEFQMSWTSKGSASGPIVIQGIPFTRFTGFGAQFGNLWMHALAAAPSASQRLYIRQVNTGSENWNLVFSNLDTSVVSNVSDTNLDASGNMYGTIDMITDDTFPTN